MSAVLSGIATGHMKENALYGSVIVIWTFYLFIFFHVALLLRTDDEGSEETMDTESQQKSTLSNEVYKQASLDVSSLVVFSHSTYRSLERMQLQIMLFD